MEHEEADRRVQQRCAKDVSMTCSHLNKNDDHIVTVRNYSSRGMYYESDEETVIGSFIVLRAMGAHEMEALASPSDQPFPFSMESSDPRACWGYRSHTVAKVIRCNKVEDATSFGVGAQVLFLSDQSGRQTIHPHWSWGFPPADNSSAANDKSPRQKTG